MTNRSTDSPDLERHWNDPPPGAAVRGDCPPAGSYLAAVSGEGSPEANRRLAEHAATCASCSLAWRLARELAAADGREARGERPDASRSRPARWLGSVAAVAAALVLAALLVPLRDTSPPPESNLRDLAGATVRSELEDRAALPRDEFVLRWSPGPEGSTYDVRVLDLRLERVSIARGLASPSYRVPAEDLSGLEAGDVVLWQVEAVLPDGRRQVSATFTNRLD